jgi:cobalt-zinc-cadmium efflux system outer membrane protein
VEVENFAGSGAFRGFDAAETTITLGQTVELGGKRLRRARVAALERDLAAWEYEATRLDVFTATTKAFIEVVSAQVQLALHEDLVHLAEQVLQTVAARERLAATWGSTTPAFERVEGTLEPAAPIPSAEGLVRRIGQNPEIARWVVEVAQR